MNIKSTTLPPKTESQIVSTDSIVMNVNGATSRSTLPNVAGALQFNTRKLFVDAQYTGFVAPYYATVATAIVAAQALDPAPDELGTEQLTNTALANSTGWTLGTGWAVSGNKLVRTAAAVTLAESDADVIPGGEYLLSFVISSRATGTVTPSLGGVVGEEVSIDGTYTRRFKAVTTDNLQFRPTDNAALSIGTISVKRDNFPVEVYVGNASDGSPLPLVDSTGASYDEHALRTEGIIIKRVSQNYDEVKIDNQKLFATSRSEDLAFRMQASNQDIRFQHAAIALMTDDGLAEDYTYFSYYNTNKIPFTMAVQFHRLDTAGFLTSAQCQEMQDKGCEITQHYHGTVSTSHPPDSTGMEDYYYRHRTIRQPPVRMIRSTSAFASTRVKYPIPTAVAPCLVGIGHGCSFCAVYPYSAYARDIINS